MIVCVVNAYPSGAPETACSNLTPQHGYVEMSEPPAGYTIAFSRYSSGPNFVEVSAPQGRQFVGFIAAMETVAGLRVGQWSSGQGYRRICKGEAVTHTNSLLRESVRLQWTSPMEVRETVVMRITILESFENFFSLRQNALFQAAHADL